MSQSAVSQRSTERLASEPDREALRTRILAGILYAAARFVPLPLLDDLLRDRVVRWMVRRTIPAHIPAETTRPLWAGGDGCLGGCLGGLAMLPIKLLLFPVRKVLSIVLAVRWVSRDLAEMLLLGRVLDHALAVGLIAEGRSDEELTRQSHELRTAFDVALQGTQTRFLAATLGSALGPVRALVAAASRAVRRLRRSATEEPQLEVEEQTVIDSSVGRVEHALLQPEVRAFLADFDRRMIENLQVLAARRGASGS